MGDQDGDAHESVRRWVETSGRAFELRVARAFRRHGSRDTDQSFRFTDSNTGLRREADVRCTYRWATGFNDRTASLIVVAECKSSTKHQWVAFYDDRLSSASNMNAWTYAHSSNDTRVLAPLNELWVGNPPFDEPQVATHIVTAHEGDKNTAGDAVRQAAAAADAERQVWLKGQSQKTNPLAMVVLTAVVTAAPLFRCRLDREGEIHIEQTSRLSVWGDSDRGPRRVFVMNEDQVPSFAEAVGERVRTAQEEAEFRKCL